MIDPPATRTLIRAVALAAGVTIGGCSLGTLNGILSSDTSDQGPAATGATHRGPPPAVNMAGRWILSTPGAGSCAMNFVAPPGASGGAIAPEGGCPGRFFTSRQWALERSTIVIRNYAGEVLAQLNAADPSRLEGKSAAGEQVILTR